MSEQAFRNGAEDVLDLFQPPVRAWFREALGEPTPAQLRGWPAIAAGQNTLILAPTGSGKTLAAFLACLDSLWREPGPAKQVQVLYVSPLKALNNDIHRNLQVPLAGVAATAADIGWDLPRLRVAVRTGDTPAAERQRLLRQPPHVLITTPESLHLLLTSRGRETLRGVRYCIVDEIHALCANKRGVFLSLLLERLEELNPGGFVRVGLSATQRPLEEVARYLGGATLDRSGALQPRPVAVIDAGLRKDIDLEVVNPVERFGPQPEKSIWPSVTRLLLDYVRAHRSTIIFANGRRSVERITTQLNELATETSRAAAEDDAGQGDESARPVARAHHGSVSLEVRRQTEEALKEGRLAAVVATASLELGIDMGAVDLVCQVESPGNVARALQRVGRAGHVVGHKSKGRLVPKTLPDLLEMAALAREMLAGRVEAIKVPTNCLDVLAQQVVAMVAVESRSVPELFAAVRRAYPYRDLSPAAFESVLEMVSGRYPSEAFRDLRPRVTWDRVHNRLHALPGSRQLALVNGGTIPDTGQYAALISGKELRIGELDEEFVYERRVGDVFMLGTSAWRIDQIEADRVFVSRAEGAPAMMPFWRGENVGRSPDLGRALGQFLRELVGRIGQPDALDWLRQQCRLDANAARDLRDYVRRQIEQAGDVPTDETLLVEAFRDQVGDWHVAVCTPFGARFHLALRLAVENRLRRRFGYQPYALHADNGLLIRLPDLDEPPLDLIDDLLSENVEDLILTELVDSALFAMRFRHNAMRSLLMPRQGPDRRAPLWLQRLKARNLLQIARQHPTFPVVVETYRECLQDHLDVPRLKGLLEGVRAGRVRVVTRRAETPSPFAAGLLFNFTGAFMYDYDKVETRSGAGSAVDPQLLNQLLSPGHHLHLLDPRAVYQVERRLRGLGQPPRTVDEMAEWLRRLGDLASAELEGPQADFLEELRRQGRACRLTLPRVREPERWVLVEEAGHYVNAFGASCHPEGAGGLMPPTPGLSSADSGAVILRRFLLTHALVGLADIIDRYPFEEDWVRGRLDQWSHAGQLIALRPEAEGPPEQWAAPVNLEQVQRGTQALLRREVLTCPARQFAEFVLRWQYRHPAARQAGTDGLRKVLDRLEGLPLPADLWELTVLPARVEGYQGRMLDELSAAGEWVWVGQGQEGPGVSQVAFLARDRLGRLRRPGCDQPAAPGDPAADAVFEHLRQRGASFLVDVATATGLTPGQARGGLWHLARQGLVTNDRFDVVRRAGDEPAIERGALNGRAQVSLHSLRRLRGDKPEGRWSLLDWGSPDTESLALLQAEMLLQRYGVVARELALLDPWLLPWRVLYEVYSRLELAGEVRRGYFVDGLSGAQFALPDAVKELAALGVPARTAQPVLLLNSLDPANVYGPGGPIDLAASFGLSVGEAGGPSLARRAGNWLAVRGGRPVLWVETHGKRLFPAPGAAEDDLREAAGLLGDLLKTAHGVKLKGKLTVEEWGGGPVTGGPGQSILEAAGFVRDYPAMALYAAWK